MSSILIVATIPVLVLVSELDRGKADQPNLPFPISACDRIFQYFPYCLEFLVGDPLFPQPSKRCCEHLDKLNILAKHRTGPKTICYCIQVMVKGMTPQIIPSKVDDLPVMCNTHLSFPISDSMDCSS